jgi:hypothetical protein
MKGGVPHALIGCNKRKGKSSVAVVAHELQRRNTRIHKSLYFNFNSKYNDNTSNMTRLRILAWIKGQSGFKAAKDSLSARMDLASAHSVVEGFAKPSNRYS